LLNLEDMISRVGSPSFLFYPESKFDVTWIKYFTLLLPLYTSPLFFSRMLIADDESKVKKKNKKGKGWASLETS